MTSDLTVHLWIRPLLPSSKLIAFQQCCSEFCHCHIIHTLIQHLSAPFHLQLLQTYPWLNPSQKLTYFFWLILPTCCPPPSDLNNNISAFLESRSYHSFNHLHTQWESFWFNKHRRKTPYDTASTLFRTQMREDWQKHFPIQDSLSSDQWFSSVCSGPLHLVGMFHTPANCLQTSVSHLCVPNESSWAPLWPYNLTMALSAVWRICTSLFWAAYSHIQSEVSHRYEPVRYLCSESVWVSCDWRPLCL